MPSITRGSVKFDPVNPLSDLIMKHEGKRICVMGGGPTLERDLENVKADVWISVNDHGAKLREVDYIVCMDNIHTKHRVEMRHYLRKFSKAPVISPWHWGQYQVLSWPGYPCLYNSGIIAAWVGYLMGAHPLILAGFDCYNGKGRIVQMHKDYLPHIKCETRVCSGILLDYYPKYDLKEKRKPFVKPEVFGEATQGFIKVRVDHPFNYRGYDWPIGSVLTVSEYEVRRQIKHKSIVKVE